MVTLTWKFVKTKYKKLPKSFLLCLIVRIFSVFFVRTSFVPDEYWQSLEVGHKIAFGYGYETWEWKLGIRSYIHPVFIALLYKILEFAQCDSVENVVIFPRLIQACMSAVCDYYFVKWHRKTTGCNGNWAWFTVITSWFWFYCASRTLVNTLEACLVMIGLYLYPWEHVILHNNPRPYMRFRYKRSQAYSYLLVAAFTCILRPTAVIFWSPLVAFNIMLTKRKKDLIYKNCLPVAIAVICISQVFDSYFHGNHVCTWWNFFNINVVKGISDFYGTHVIFWYLVIGLPTILGPMIIPFAFGISKIVTTTKTLNIEIILLITGCWSLCVLSMLSHKEFRFLMPIMPLCFHVVASHLSLFSRRATALRRYAAAIFIVLTSIVAGVYLGRYHQRGTLDTMDYLAKESWENPADTNLLFLMPCHSTPLYSHLHINVTTRFLTCEPDVFGDMVYFDEAEEFYAHPRGWLNRTFPANGTLQLPSHIIIFDPLRNEIDSFLNANGYFMSMEFHHTAFPDGRVGNYFLVFKRMLTKPQPHVFDEFGMNN